VFNSNKNYLLARIEEEMKVSFENGELVDILKLIQFLMS
jgi:hypothetical protein